MRPIPPQGDFPENVKGVIFRAPEEREDVQDIAGLVHLSEEGNPVAMEFMFELTKDEIRVLRHEPYITVLIEGGELSPFTVQTTYPPSDKFITIMEHSHVCTANLTHESQRWWRCDNPTHDSKGYTTRTCDDCYEHRMEELQKKLEESKREDDSAVEDDSGKSEVQASQEEE